MTESGAITRFQRCLEEGFTWGSGPWGLSVLACVYECELQLGGSQELIQQNISGAFPLYILAQPAGLWVVRPLDTSWDERNLHWFPDHFHLMPQAKKKNLMGPPFNGETRLWKCKYSQCAMQSSQAGGPTPAFPGKVAILTQEARAGSLIIKAKCLPFEEFRETKCQWRVTHPWNKHYSDRG